VEGVILPLAAGYVNFTVSVQVGPRFPSVERIVTKAGRAAGLPQASLRTASVFPTVFDHLGRISPLEDNTPIWNLEEIVGAIRVHAVPFVLSISTIGAAADYALTNPLAYGAHSMRIPVLLAKAGRLKDARDYLDCQISAEAPYADFFLRYRSEVLPLL
jgi:hypothetical protein